MPSMYSSGVADMMAISFAAKSRAKLARRLPYSARVIPGLRSSMFRISGRVEDVIWPATARDAEVGGQWEVEEK